MAFFGGHTDDNAVTQNLGATGDGAAVPGLAAWPNPTRAEATIAVNLREPGFLTLAVYDVAGRLIKVLSARPAPAGVSLFHWNGRDARGSDVAGGVYFCRITTPTSTDTEAVVITR